MIGSEPPLGPLGHSERTRSDGDPHVVGSEIVDSRPGDLVPARCLPLEDLA